MTDEKRNELIRELAKLQWEQDGEIEIDAGAVVSEGDDNGAYVQVWVWVDFEGNAELSKSDDNS